MASEDLASRAAATLAARRGQLSCCELAQVEAVGGLQLQRPSTAKLLLPPWASPQLALCASSGRAWRLWGSSVLL